MQAEDLVSGLDYLKNPSGKETLRLVAQFNLFLDDLGIIRSK